MDDLIARSLSGEITDLEERLLHHWRALSPDNERTFAALQRTWALTGAVAGRRRVPPLVGDLIETAERRRRLGAVQKRRRAFLRSPWLGFGLAAAGLAAAVAVRLKPTIVPDSSALTPLESSSRLSSVVTMSLSDGSVVRVAPATKLSFPPQSDRREVVLEGTAFFAVTPGAKPFVVHTSTGDVTVRGTRFEIRAERERLRVVVVEGQVHIAGERGTMDLDAGQVAFVEKDGSPRIVASADPLALIDWSPELLMFQGTPLQEVGVELGRHFHRRVEVTPDLQPIRITVWFEGDPVDEVVSSVCLIAGARCSVTDSTITIGPMGQ